MTRKRFLSVLSLITLIFIFFSFSVFYLTSINTDFLEITDPYGRARSISVSQYKDQIAIIESLPQNLDEALIWLEREVDIYKNPVETNSSNPFDTQESRAYKLENLLVVKKLCEDALNYENYVADIQDTSGFMLSNFINNTDDPYFADRMVRYKNDYKGLEDTRPGIAHDYTIALLLKYHVTDLLAVLYIFIVTLAMYHYMKKQAVEDSRFTKKAFRDYYLIMLLGLMLMYVTNILAIKFNLGLPRLTLPLQSLQIFYSCPYEISILTFLITNIGMKLLALLVVSSFFMLVLFKASWITAVISTAFLVLEFILHRFSSALFGEINFFSAFDSERFFNRYSYLEVGPFLIGRTSTFVVLMILATLLLTILVVMGVKKISRESAQKLQEEYLGEINDRYKETRRLWHDFNNHLLAIRSLYELGNSQEAIKYIDDLTLEMQKNLLPVKTGSDMVDLFFFRKLQQAGDEIEIRYEIECSLKDLKIDSFDLCSLLGNMLDNAIEAVRKLDNASKPVIRVRISRQNSILFISCANPYSGNLNKSGNSLITSKDNKSEHGIGMSSMKQICDKYMGSMQFENENNIFTLNLLLNEKN